MRIQNKTTTSGEIADAIMEMADGRQASHLMRFFKTGKGQYGEGDRFLGLRCPQTRMVVKEARLTVPLPETEKLLYSEWHEIRLAGFLLLVEEMKAALPRRKESPADKASRRDEIAAFYLRHAPQANNWDLVDLTCPKILGEWLLHPSASGQLPDRRILDRLADSDCLWEQRIAIVTTWRLIKEYQFDEALRLSARFLNHPHDLIHKATGWMLREVGKKNISELRRFLDAHCTEMPRTALRYAIEKMTDSERRQWLTR